MLLYSCIVLWLAVYLAPMRFQKVIPSPQGSRWSLVRWLSYGNRCMNWTRCFFATPNALNWNLKTQLKVHLDAGVQWQNWGVGAFGRPEVLCEKNGANGRWLSVICACCCWVGGRRYRPCSEAVWTRRGPGEKWRNSQKWRRQCHWRRKTKLARITMPRALLLPRIVVNRCPVEFRVFWWGGRSPAPACNWLKTRSHIIQFLPYYNW